MLELMKTMVGSIQLRGVSKLNNNPLDERKRLKFSLPECTHSDCGKGKECYHGTATWYPVNWPVGDASWKDTEEYFKDKTGIYRYRLYKQPKPRIHQYTLSISVIDGGSGWGRTYTFEDQEGDQYGLTVFTDGDHYVDFDSHAPKITRVKDSET